MEENSIKFTAFKIENKKYEFLQVPFGLSNAPMTFQDSMETLFSDLDKVMTYLGHIAIHTRDISSHYNVLEKVISIIKENKISVNFEKSTFMKNEVKFIGHIINEKEIQPDISRTKALGKIKPKRKKGTEFSFRDQVNIHTTELMKK
ncbi:Retrovirus-related Pol polyprotein from transposon opus [Dictyocoela muelleri]|nr:Retrovirus-related Pol polyprotein from transposon opus [Dictyocoela muelleri]